MNTDKLRVALVHDWLTGMRGGEKVLECFCELFPQADIYTLLWIKGSVSKIIESKKIKTSFLQTLPFVEKKYRYYLPFMPKAIESFNLSKYDLVISSSHCVAKGIKIKPGTPHICYCYTPMRYIWDQHEEYFNSERSGIVTSFIMKMILNYLRNWDIKSAENVKTFIAISNCVKERINRIYKRDSIVIYPPVDVNNYPKISNNNYYLIVSALVPYKRVDLAVKTFNELGLELKIVGSGPDEQRLKKLSKNNIQFLGWISNEEIKKYYAGCKAFIFPQEEDFGITAVEAQAAGKPVIAYKKGGALDTVIDGITGVFFNEPTPSSLANAVKSLEMLSFNETMIKENAAKFAKDIFMKKIRDVVLQTFL